GRLSDDADREGHERRLPAAAAASAARRGLLDDGRRRARRGVRRRRHDDGLRPLLSDREIRDLLRDFDDARQILVNVDAMEGVLETTRSRDVDPHEWNSDAAARAAATTRPARA